MPKVNNVKHIVLHCSAGFTLIPAIENYWYKTLKWKSPGYSGIIYPNGEKWYVTKDGSYSKDKSKWYPQLVTNGVLGWNEECLHFCYIGGVEKIKDKWVGKDTRTEEQKAGLIDFIRESFEWLISEGVDTSKQKVSILGHRDFSNDKNGNGVIESWERIKECPSYDVIPEYEWMTIQFGKTTLPKK